MTQNQKDISKRFLVYKFLTNLWFVSAIWLYFYRIFITDQEVGMLDGMAFAIGLLAEVPSGVMADKFGRDRMVKLGQFLAGSGFLIQAFGSNFVPFFVGQTVLMIGVSFVSGADEALFFDKLQFKKMVDWRKLVTRGTQLALVGSIVALMVGGWLYEINPRIPWILTGLSLISSLLIIWPIKESRIKRDRQKLFSELKEQLVDIKAGFSEFATQKLFLYVSLIITVQGLFLYDRLGAFTIGFVRSLSL
jgi:MFS family permease